MQIVVSRRGLLIVVVAWFALALFGFFRQHPFRVATEMATVAGGWSPEQVRFEQGSYLFLFAYSLASARVAVTTEAGEIPAEIKIRHVPLAGWSVQSFEICDPHPQQAKGPGSGCAGPIALSTS